MERKQSTLVKKEIDTQLEASKWIDCPLLLSETEMKSLLELLGQPYLFPISRPLSPDLNFTNEYANYVAALEKGDKPKNLQAYLMTNSLEAVYALQLSDGRELVRPYLPCILVRPHHVNFSPEDRKFRSKVYGENAITWGYTFSYPQFCLDPTTHDVEKVDERYSNTPLFKQIQRWMRESTTPTPFLYKETKINAPIRLGKEALYLAKNHFQLKQQDLDVSL